MKKIYYLLMAAFAVLCVCSSCSKDDEGSGGTSYEELIVGTWKLDEVYDIEEERYHEDETIAKIKTNGTAYMSYDDGTSMTANWSIVSNTLYLEARGEKYAYTINKLDNKEMVLTWVEDGKEIEIDYFSRIE
ncbi:MAG: lipocalin family protein [Alistipes sp.]|nr:lipocalin family protein [Alistipes sp.]